MLSSTNVLSSNQRTENRTKEIVRVNWDAYKEERVRNKEERVRNNQDAYNEIEERVCGNQDSYNKIEIVRYNSDPQNQAVCGNQDAYNEIVRNNSDPRNQVHAYNKIVRRSSSTSGRERVRFICASNP